MAMELSCDLLEEILSRVPATSLAPLRYTCKQWKTLIEDPKFVKRHMSLMRFREQQVMAFNYKYCVGIDFNEPNKPVLHSHVFSDLPLISMAHCDGLLLLVLRKQLLVVNPLLKHARSIKNGDGFYHTEDAYGIGHISNQSDYKVVIFGSAPYGYRVGIYEFKSDSWKTHIDVSFEGFEGRPCSSVSVRGTPYWIGCSRKDYFLMIQSFDFSKERFEPLSLPISDITSDNYVSLGSFSGDHLSMLYQCNETGEIHIWVMKQQWSNLKTVAVRGFSFFSKLVRYFTDNNGNLVLSGCDCEMGRIRINIVGESNNECQQLKHCCDMYHMIGCCYYVPSLLQVPSFSG